MKSVKRQKKRLNESIGFSKEVQAKAGTERLDLVLSAFVVVAIIFFSSCRLLRC